jgi:hypothetical protein
MLHINGSLRIDKAGHTRWRLSQSHFESGLQSRAAGSNTEDRSKLSHKIFKTIRERLEESICSTPDILFICGAGNEGHDVDFAGCIPASLRLPNLMVVGAVNDQDNFNLKLTMDSERASLTKFQLETRTLTQRQG